MSVLLIYLRTTSFPVELRFENIERLETFTYRYLAVLVASLAVTSCRQTLAGQRGVCLAVAYSDCSGWVSIRVRRPRHDESKT